VTNLYYVQVGIHVDGRNSITSRRDEYGGNLRGPRWVNTASRPGVAGRHGGDAREHGSGGAEGGQGTRRSERGVAVRGGTMFARPSLF
jgi:hypothetical protein